MAPIDDAIGNRNATSDSIKYVKTKVQAHTTKTLSISMINKLLKTIGSAESNLIQSHTSIVRLKPTDMTTHTEIYKALLDEVIEATATLEEIKAASAKPLDPTPPVDYQDIQLKKIQLPTFDVNFLNWLSFRDIFETTIHNHPKYNKVQKFFHLKSALSGDALRQIQSLVLTEVNYDTAWTQICHRCQNTRELFLGILRRFTEQLQIQPHSTAIHTLIDISKDIIRQLDSLQLALDDGMKAFMYFHIFYKLDKQSRELWEQNLKDSTIPDVLDLFDFLEQRARSLAAGSAHQNLSGQRNCGENQHRVARAHHTTEAVSCQAGCSNFHPLFKCSTFYDMRPSERSELVKKKALCFNCLQSGHANAYCTNKGRCRTCQGKHHSLLCRNTEFKSKEENIVADESASLTLSHHSDGADKTRQTILATALIKVVDSSGQLQTVRALLDGGSTSSFITEPCLRRLGLSKTSSNAEVKGLASLSVGFSKAVAALQFQPHFHSGSTFYITALVLPKVTGKLPMHQCDLSQWPHLHNLQLVDPQFYIPSTVDILLGSDVFWDLLLDRRRRGKVGSPVGIETQLGWIIAGNLNQQSQQVRVHFSETSLDQLVKSFWEIEAVPKMREMTKEETIVEKHYADTHKRNSDGSYTVSIPWKTPTIQLGASYEMALRRFKQLERRLQANPLIRKQYIEFMKEYEVLGHMELVKSEPTIITNLPLSSYRSCGNPSINSYYIPHHFVTKEGSTTTKLRVVFDASAKTSSGSSLNDTLMVGPTLQDNLTDIIIRFRCHTVALTADIAKMYRMVKLNSADQDFQRIIWRESQNESIKEYTLKTVTYGTAAAPYLATKTIQQLARDKSGSLPIGSEVAMRDFYVDNLMSGANTVDEAIEIKKSIARINKSGWFHSA